MLHAPAANTGSSPIADFLPEDVTEEMLLDGMWGVVGSLDLQKVVAGDNVRLTQMLIDRLGLEKTAKWSLMHLLGSYFFHLCDVDGPNVHPRAADVVIRFERFLPKLASDPEAFAASFLTLREQLNAFSRRLPQGTGQAKDRRLAAYQYLEHLLFQVVRPSSSSIAEDFVLYPAAVHARRLLAKQPVSSEKIGQFNALVQQLVSEVLSSETLFDEGNEDRQRDVNDLRDWIQQWVADNVKVATA